MRWYRLKAILESPLVVKRDRQSQRSEGVEYLAGSLVRGALAQVYLHWRGEADDAFGLLFLDETRARFGPLDPAERVLPATSVSCKRKPGFRGAESHGMRDLLWLRLAQRLLGTALQPEHCVTCGQDMKPQLGFWRENAEASPHLPRERNRRLAMHVGIERVTHSAAPSILYSLDALEPTEGEALEGIVELDASARVILQDLLKEAGAEVRVGHARTRGYGRVTLKLGEEILARSDEGWAAWSEVCLAYLGRHGDSPLRPEHHFVFTLSFPTGAILLDEVLRATLDPAGMVPWLPPLPRPDLLQPLNQPGTAIDGGTLRCLTAVARHERVRGWNAAHGLPRQDEWAVSRGSVYAYCFEGDTAARQSFVERLNTLTRAGVGARRNEGFGRVLVSDDFHSQFSEQERETP